MNLREKIENYQNGNEKEIVKILEEINSIFKIIKFKYDEEVEGEVICYTITFLKKIDISRFENTDYLKNYIKKSLINRAKDVLKKKYKDIEKITYNTDLLEIEGNKLVNSNLMESKLEFTNLLECLNKRERKIINMFFYDKSSIQEIARELELSRQYVNKTKNRALDKLRKVYLVS